MMAQPLEPRISRLEGAFEQIVERLGDTNARLETLDQKMELNFHALLTTMDTRFAAIDTRFAAMDTRFLALERKFIALDDKFAAMVGQFAAMVGQFAAMVGQFAAMVGHFAAMDGKLAAMDDKFAVKLARFRGHLPLSGEGVPYGQESLLPAGVSAEDR